MRDIDDSFWTTCVHEACHAVAGEAKGLAIKEVTSRASRDALGSVRFEPHIGSSESHIVATLAPQEMFRALGWSEEGCERDVQGAFSLAHIISDRTGENHFDILARARGEAYALVTHEEMNWVIERVALKLYERPRRLDATVFGEIVRSVRSQYRAEHRDWLAPARAPGALDGMGLAEELAERNAVIAEATANLPMTSPEARTPRPTATAGKGKVVSFDHRRADDRKRWQEFRERLLKQQAKRLGITLADLKKRIPPSRAMSMRDETRWTDA